MKKKAMITYTTIVRRTQSPRMSAAFRSSSRMMVTTETTIVPNGMPRRSALPVSRDRQVFVSLSGHGPSLAAPTSEEAVLAASDVQA